MIVIWLLVVVFLGVASTGLYYLFKEVYEKYKERKCQQK
jgi:hypothetical protein